MLTAVHNHFNLRKLCDVDLSIETSTKLDRPPALANPRALEDHVVKIPTPHGEIVLFRVSARGLSYLVTATPDILLKHVSPTAPVSTDVPA